MNSVLTDDEKNILCDMHRKDPWALVEAAQAAVIRKLAAGVSVEPDVISEKTDEPYAYSPDAFTTAIAAARVQENERCLALMDAIGCDWRDAGDMAKFYAANYLCDAIRALMGKEQS